jgi:hypothetical protein
MTAIAASKRRPSLAQNMAAGYRAAEKFALDLWAEAACTVIRLSDDESSEQFEAAVANRDRWHAEANRSTLGRQSDERSSRMCPSRRLRPSRPTRSEVGTSRGRDSTRTSRRSKPHRCCCWSVRCTQGSFRPCPHYPISGYRR